MSDAFFGPPQIDRDEWRDAPVRHRYVHGGFEGTDTRFAFHLLDPSLYQGRLIQFLQGGAGGNEHAGVLGGLPVAIEWGACLIESNQGHIGNDLSGLKGDQTILNYRASAQTARYAKEVMAEMYGEPPHHAYLTGGSGGAARTIACLEAVSDLWDGGVPFMHNWARFTAYNWSVTAWAESILRDKIPDIVDALDAGGSGDPFAVLDTVEQRHALATLYRAGFPRGAESQIVPNPINLFALNGVRTIDAQYLTDFWTKPGYEGAEDGSRARRDAVERRAVVTRMWTAGELGSSGFGLEDINAGVLSGWAAPDLVAGAECDFEAEQHEMVGAVVRIVSGKAAGRELVCSGVVRNALCCVLDPVGWRDVEPGDSLEIHNRDMIAFKYLHRHFCKATYPLMRQFFVDGTPVYPQRWLYVDFLPVPQGTFHGKMIFVQHAKDRECWPTGATFYRDAVRRRLGDAIDDRFRLYWMDNAAHLSPITDEGKTRLIQYGGGYAHALGALVAWVEDGIEPSPSDRIAETDGRIVLPARAADRGGIQPCLTATANGTARAEVKVGEEVRFAGVVDVPGGGGLVANAAWDFDGSGTFPAGGDVPSGTQSPYTFEATFAYEKPGTYIATFRAGTHRRGPGAESVQFTVNNLARVRVIVRDEGSL